MSAVDALDSVRQDLRYALRTFRRSPTFTVTVDSMIACGLALNVAVFTLFSHYVLRPFPVHAPDSLYEFSWADCTGSAQGFAWPAARGSRRTRKSSRTSQRSGRCSPG